MRQFLRTLLGINDLYDKLSELTDEVFKLRNDLTVTYRDEYSKDRKQLSDELAAKAIQKLKAEDWARKHTTGEG